MARINASIPEIWTKSLTRDDTAIGEEDTVERAISVHQDLTASAANVLKLWHELLEIAGWQGK
jgi:hypothetical protein